MGPVGLGHSAESRTAQTARGIMDHETALSKARDIADGVLAPAAQQHDKEGRFSTEAVAALSRAGFLGLMLPIEIGGAGGGPPPFSHTRTPAASGAAGRPPVSGPPPPRATAP